MPLLVISFHNLICLSIIILLLDWIEVIIIILLMRKYNISPLNLPTERFWFLKFQVSTISL